MADDHKRIEEVDRGRQARAIVESAVWVEAWARLDAELIAKWRTSPARDAQGRETLWMALNLAEKVRRSIEQVMQTGKMAEIQLEETRNGRSG